MRANTGSHFNMVVPPPTAPLDGEALTPDLACKQIKQIPLNLSIRIAKS